MRAKTQDDKELQGTFEPSKEGLESVELENWDGVRMPAASSEWPPNIQEIWNQRCKDLFKAGYLAKAFLPHLRRYCFALMQAEEAEEKLMLSGFVIMKVDVKGNTQEIVSPWLYVLDNANKMMDKIGAKFGFTPLDIQKIPIVKQKEKSDTSLLK